MKKFYIETLGCKVNQYESDGIAQKLEKSGWIKTCDLDDASVLIVNTCAVTSKAAMQSRQAIRKLIRRKKPEARVIATGCHVQTDPDLIRQIDDIDHIICNQDKFRIADCLSSGKNPLSGLHFKKTRHDSSCRFHCFDPAVTGEMTRAYLKIQDGCNAFCTYCIVPHARGASVSMPEDQVFEHLNALATKGVKEVIITGIHTGLYGKDLGKKITLSELLAKINEKKPVHRIRLSSIEPNEITDDLIDLACKGGILCDHFHIPLQSGDDDILKKMKRPYDTALFEDVIHRIHEKIPLAGIGLDVIAGFPSETSAMFENTCRLIERLPVTYLHVFPFSPRKGTPAFHFSPRVDSRIIRERCAVLREMGKIKKKKFAVANLAKRVEALVQNTRDQQTGFLKAVTSNYLFVLLPPEPELRGKIIDIIPKECNSFGTLKGMPVG